MRKFVWRAVTIAIFVACTPLAADAQPASSQNIAAAQALVEEASDLMDAKKFAEACPKLEQATKLVPDAVGARFALAECYEGMGRLASAQGQYLLAGGLAEKTKDTRRAKEAAAEAKRLKPKLATMTLTVPDEVRAIEGVQLTWDGVAWEPAVWGTPMPVDTGKHDLEVQAPGWKPWKTEVTVEANGKASSQSVPMLEKLPKEPPKPTLDEPRSPEKPSPSRLPLLLTGIGLSAVGIGLGVGFTVAAAAKNKEAVSLANEIRLERSINETLCPSSSTDQRCSDLGALESRRDVFATVGIAGFVVGGVAVVGTTVLALTRQTGDKRAAPKDAFMVIPMPRGLSVLGTF
jgi:tetratricopeptide (TPR) repeat protein